MSFSEPLPEDVTYDAEPVSANSEPQTEVNTFAREGLSSDHSGQSTQNIDQTCTIPDQHSSEAICDRTIEGATADLTFQSEEFTEEDYVSDAEFRIYQDRFPDHLRTDFHDAMIVYHEKDYTGVKSLLDKIESEVTLDNGEKPRVELYDLIGPETGTYIAQLEHSLKHCRYAFLYITDTFLKDSLTRFLKNTCIWASATSSGESFSYVPVLTNSNQKVPGVLPLTITVQQSIELWKDEQMINRLKTLFEHALTFRKEKAAELQHQRKLWIMEERNREKREHARRAGEVQTTLRRLRFDDENIQ